MDGNKKYTRDIEPAFIEQLKEGAFKEFLAFVKEHEDELALCFRGNHHMVSIYRDNHIVWNLYNLTAQNKVKISFDHARFCEDWESGVLDRLEQEGCGFESIRRKQGKELIICTKSNRSYRFSAGSVCRTETDKKNIFDRKACVEGSYTIIEKMHDTYKATLSSSFKGGERTNYFAKYYLERHPERKEELGKYLKAHSKNLLEKEVQQKVFIHNDNTDNGILIYDMEFAQPRISGEKLKNEPDMLGIRYEKGEPQAIVLVEIKCTKAACLGKSGVKKHLDGMRAYVDENADTNKKNPSLIQEVKEHRREEAVKILKAYRELGLRHLEKEMKFDNISALPFEIMFVFTHKSYRLFKEEGKDSIRRLFPEGEYQVYDSENKKDNDNMPINLGMNEPYAVVVSRKYG